MSYAIFDLEIELRPVIVRATHTPDGRTLYVARCEVCFQVTRPQPRISAVIRRQHHHGQKHVGEMLRRACPQPAARETVVKPRTRIVRAIVAAPTRRDAA